MNPESQITAKHKWHRPVFDHNTSKLPVYLEQLNQRADKAFGDNAQSMIDCLFYAKLPQNSGDQQHGLLGTYYEIVDHIGRELELNAIDDSDNEPMVTMTSSASKNLLFNGLLTDIF